MTECPICEDDGGGRHSLFHDLLLSLQEFVMERGINAYYDPGCGGLAPFGRSWYVIAAHDGFRVYDNDAEGLRHGTLFDYADPDVFDKLYKRLKKWQDLEWRPAQ